LVISEDFIKEINKCVLRCAKDETQNTPLEFRAKSAHKQYKVKDESSMGSNLRVLDICNPVHAYYEILNPSIEIPKELQEKFNYGNFSEKVAQSILSNEIGFMGTQGSVDGSKCGMPDIKGKIDFRVKDKIIEFKTSEYDIPNVDTLFRKNPQDVEQLLIYIIFSGREKRDHRLLYLTGKYPDLVAREFKVSIKNRDELVEYFISRKNMLKHALEIKDSTGLGRCRYFDSSCQFKSNGICNCKDEEEINIEEVKKTIYVSPVDDYSDKFSPTHISENPPKMNLWDIISPRHYFLRTSNPFVYNEWNDDDKYKFYLRKAIERELEDGGSVVKKRYNLEHITEHLSIKIPNNEQKYEYRPVIVRVNDSNALGSIQLNPYYIAQLGLSCALSDCNKGYVLVYYKNSKASVLWKVIFNDLSSIKDKTSEIINVTMNSVNSKTFNENLQLCPEFMKKKCYNSCKCIS